MVVILKMVSNTLKFFLQRKIKEETFEWFFQVNIDSEISSLYALAITKQ